MAPETRRVRLHPRKLEFLLARRLVEAGVPVVTLAVHGWDTHEKNFEVLSVNNCPSSIRQAARALLTDLEMRRPGTQDVTVIMGGEMGRTPRITKERAGREHWPVTGITVMAGMADSRRAKSSAAAMRVAIRFAAERSRHR